MISFVLLISIAIAGCNTGTKSSGSSDATTAPKAKDNIKVIMMPKAIGNSYFAAAEAGAKEVSGGLKIDFTFNGPTSLNASQQVSMINGYIAQGYDVLAISATDPTSLVPALTEAKKKGIKVITWDSDVEKSARDYFVNAATSEGIGSSLAKLTSEKFKGEKVDVAILTSTPTDPNQNDWIGSIKKAIAAKYTNLNIVTTQYDNGEPAQALTAAGDIMKAFPNVKAIISPESIGLPAAAEAIEKAGMQGKVYVTGLANPAVMKQYVHSGTVEQFVLWDVKTLGKLTMYVARAVSDGTMPTSGKFKAGDLGEYEIIDGNVMLGTPFVYDKSNVDNFDY
jgi:ABC-type sugar transport system substrate-binding protein